MSDLPSQSKDAWSSSTYQTNASFVYSDENTSPVLRLLDPKLGERILDLGCGSGELTQRLSALVGPSGHVHGVDSSNSMVDAARSLGLTVSQGDMQALVLTAENQGSYDAVFSSAALHWCKDDPEGVVKGAYTALKKGGRFVGECGGFLNCVGVRTALHIVLKKRGHNAASLDPWYFTTPECLSTQISKHKFTRITALLHPRPTRLPTGLRGWLTTFTRTTWLAGLDDREAEAVMSEVEEMCGVDMRDEKGQWTMMYVRLRWSAVKE